ncbi:hypothetical protein VTP01DRAFT_8354 [Rhizomucor pusillus]|uniref:uncharacterized protein n=1 Tax=Rhizomucor pusillus TaxID=4840 RepID=UPI003743F1D8
MMRSDPLIPSREKRIGSSLSRPNTSRRNFKALQNAGTCMKDKRKIPAPAEARSAAGERSKKQAVTVIIDQANLEAAFNTQLRKFLEDAYQKRVLKNKVPLQDFLSRERSRKKAPAVHKEVHKQLCSSLSDEQKPNPSYIGTYVKRYKTYNLLNVYQRLLDDLEEGKAKNIVYPDFEPSVLQEAFRKEQEIVSKHIKSLSRFIEAFTTKVTTGEISKISGYPDSTTKAVDIDFRDFATNFEFDKEAETKLRVEPVQEYLQKLHQSKVYTVEHLSNIMSGCIGRSINEKKESETFKQIRQLLLQAVNGDKQDASIRHSPTIADAVRQYKTNMDNLWSRKLFDRDLRVLVIALLLITLAPRRLEKFLRKRQQKVEEKKEEGQAIHKSGGKGKGQELDEAVGLRIASGQHDWVNQSLVEKLKSAISQPREQTRSNVRTEDAYESNIFDLSEEEEEDNIEEQEDTPIASNQTPKEPSASLLRAFLNVIRFLLQQRGPNTDIQPEDVKRALYRGTEATEDQLKENTERPRRPSTLSNNLSGEGLVQELLYEHLQGQRNVGITGIDPGRVTTATISTRRIRSLFEDINRFEALQEDTDQIADIDTDVERCPKPVELKTGLIENATFRKVHRVLREQGQETNVKQARTREFREKSFYQKFGSGIRKEAVSKEPEKKISVIHFLGSWKPVNNRVKGHACSGSLKKLEQTLKAPEPDKLYTIDEYNTTKTCGYCFKKIQIHKYRRDGKFVKVKAKMSF